MWHRLKGVIASLIKAIGADTGSVGRWVCAGYAATLLLFSTFAMWGTVTKLASAVIAGGHLVVDSHSKDVQHKEGGTVKSVHVRDGDHVAEGQVLVTLDETAARADLEIISKNQSELLTKIARLEAERDGLDEIAFPEKVMTQSEEAHVFTAITNALHMFAARRSLRKSERQQLEQQLVQLEELIRGYEVQKAATEEEYELIDAEVERLEGLYKDKLVPVTRLTEAKRNAARLKGQIGAAEAEIARAKERISEVRSR